MSATAEVRQELAGSPLDSDEVPAELGALLRAGGSLLLGGAGASVELATTTGAVARRAHALLERLHVVPTLWVRDATNLRRRTYGVEAPLVGALADTLLDRGRPRRTAPADDLEHPAALVRGALLGAGSVSAPRRPPHLELIAAHESTADQLADVVATIVGVRPSVGTTRGGSHRTVLKSGEAIASLLGSIGAPGAFLARDEQRLRRELRGEAQRLANADAANVRRAVDAASDQVVAVERAVELLGWAALPPDLRDVALARLANPAASLAELGELCDPPVGKSAVHRRLGRLGQLVRDAEGAAEHGGAGR